MKLIAKQTETKKQIAQPKANKQASENSILQKYKTNTAQLKSSEEEELVQRKFETTQLAQEGEKPLQHKSNTTGLPDNLKSGVENLSGYSMDDVKVHYNSSQPATLQAHAYAQGTDIHIAPGQEKHLAHEAWHVVQQKQGRVKPTKQLKGTTNINDDAGLEKEADVMGAKASEITQLFAVPANLNNMANDVNGTIADIQNTQPHINTIPPGGDSWADETRSASMRKLSEWDAFKLSNSQGLASEFGTDVVQEPDVFERNNNGNMTNVVENKYVSGGRGQISENVKNALGQIVISNRSPNYEGQLFARIHLSDSTREDLRNNGSTGGDTRMINSWQSYATSLVPKSRIVNPYNVTIEVINLPNRTNGGHTNYSKVLI